MTALEKILEEQRKRAEKAPKWSYREGYGDYLANYEDNFIISPMNPKIIDAYRDGAGSEIPTENCDYRVFRGKKVPLKMQAIHSSSALVCNAFGYWYDQQDRTPLRRALGCTGKITRIEFEGKKPTGLSGIPPHLDVVFYSDGMVYAVESKFSEPYQEEKKKIVMGSKSYDPVLWRKKELGKCADLVDQINKGKMDGIFKRLSVNQLLKHILGLHKQHEGSFELLYLWYEVPGTQESDTHRAEIEDFSARIGKEVTFKSMTYQELFAALKGQYDGQHQDYLNKFSARYL